MYNVIVDSYCILLESHSGDIVSSVSIYIYLCLHNDRDETFVCWIEEEEEGREAGAEQLAGLDEGGKPEHQLQGRKRRDWKPYKGIGLM